MSRRLARVFAVSVLLMPVLLARLAYPQPLPPDSPPPTDAASKIDPLLQAQLQSAQAGDLITVIVTLREQADFRGIRVLQHFGGHSRTAGRLWFAGSQPQFRGPNHRRGARRPYHRRLVRQEAVGWVGLSPSRD